MAKIHIQGANGNVAEVDSSGNLQTTGAGGGGGGASTIADGADVAQGTTTDAATANTVIGRLQKLVSLLPTVLVSDRLKVDGSGVTQPVSGTFFQATQPVSAATLPLPTGASTSTLQGGGLPSALVSDRMKVEDVGNVASAATDSGNPVKVGGKYNLTIPTFTDGQRADLQVDSRGYLRTGIFDSGSAGSLAAGVNTPAVGRSAGVAGVYSLAFPMLINPAGTADPLRGTSALTVLASGARTTTQTQPDATNYNHRGIRVIIDVTSPGTGSITLTVQGKDANGIYYTLLTGAAITTTSTNQYEVFPGSPVTANATVNSFLPRTYRTVVTANNANSVTYSVSAELML